MRRWVIIDLINLVIVRKEHYEDFYNYIVGNKFDGEF